MQERSTRISVLVNFLTPRPDCQTGISNYTFQMLAALARRRDLRLVLLTNWNRSAIPAPLDALGIELVRCRVPASAAFLLAYGLFLVPFIARRLNSDIVFTPQHIGTVFGGKARVSVLHDLYIVTHRQFYSLTKKLLWKIAFPLSAARSARLVCVSNATRNALIRLYPRHAGKSVTIHEAPCIKPTQHTAPPDSDTQPYGLMVMHATPNKNAQCVFEALALLENTGELPRIYWVGRDETGEMERLMHRYGCPKNFIPLGEVSDETLEALYANARFYVTTSLVEGFCLPVLEAQGFDVPVLCSDIDTLREVTGGAALTFNAARPDALASLIHKIIRDDALHADLSKRGKSNAEKFSWEIAAIQMTELFRDCLAEFRARTDDG